MSKSLYLYQNVCVAVELKAPAIVLDVKKFHISFLYSKTCLPEIQKIPLDINLQKVLTEATTSLQKLLMRTLPNDFDARYRETPRNQQICLFMLRSINDHHQAPNLVR